MSDELRCGGSDYVPNSFHGVRACTAKGVKIRSDGKPWCGIHSPNAKAKREAKIRLRFDAKMAAARLREQTIDAQKYVLGELRKDKAVLREAAQFALSAGIMSGSVVKKLTEALASTDGNTP